MKIKIDKEKCIGCGACGSLEPAVFHINSEDGKAEANAKNCDKEKLEGCREAARVCPVAAITIEE